jgi:hypothetical protein
VAEINSLSSLSIIYFICLLYTISMGIDYARHRLRRYIQTVKLNHLEISLLDFPMTSRVTSLHSSSRAAIWKRVQLIAVQFGVGLA